MEDLVDGAWTCCCGSLNALYLDNCGGCDKPKLSTAKNF